MPLADARCSSNLPNLRWLVNIRRAIIFLRFSIFHQAPEILSRFWNT